MSDGGGGGGRSGVGGSSSGSDSRFGSSRCCCRGRRGVHKADRLRCDCVGSAEHAGDHGGAGEFGGTEVRARLGGQSGYAQVHRAPHIHRGACGVQAA